MDTLVIDGNILARKEVNALSQPLPNQPPTIEYWRGPIGRQLPARYWILVPALAGVACFFLPFTGFLFVTVSPAWFFDHMLEGDYWRPGVLTLNFAAAPFLVYALTRTGARPWHAAERWGGWLVAIVCVTAPALFSCLILVDALYETAAEMSAGSVPDVKVVFFAGVALLSLAVVSLSGYLARRASRTGVDGAAMCIALMGSYVANAIWAGVIVCFPAGDLSFGGWDAIGSGMWLCAAVSLCFMIYLPFAALRFWPAPARRTT